MKSLGVLDAGINLGPIPLDYMAPGNSITNACS